MDTPQCKQCRQKASISLAFHVSTIGLKQRLQKMSRGVRLCESCMQAACHEVELVAPSAVSESLAGAYAEIAKGCNVQEQAEQTAGQR